METYRRASLGTGCCARAVAQGFSVLTRTIAPLHGCLRDACAQHPQTALEPGANLLLTTAYAASDFAEAFLPAISRLAACLHNWTYDVGSDELCNACWGPLTSLQENALQLHAAVEQVQRQAQAAAR
jgi:hypothetical protein